MLKKYLKSEIILIKSWETSKEKNFVAVKNKLISIQITEKKYTYW